MCSPFTDINVENWINSIDSAIKNNMKVEKYITWLKKTPKLTTYRVNPLLSEPDILLKIVQEHLLMQTKLHGRKCTPKVFKIFPETIAIEKWHDEDLELSFTEAGGPQVIVDAACGVAVLRGSHVFAPGVMGLPTDVRLNDEVNIYADASGNCKKGLKIEYDTGIKVLVGRGKLKMLRHELYKDNVTPRGIAIENIMPCSGVPVIENNLLPIGSSLLQNLPSIICGKVLNPMPGDTVMDMCASPGNKTSHLAEIMKNKGCIIAVDKSLQKINLIKTRCKEFSITCVYPFVYDSTKAFKDMEISNDNNLETVLKGPPFMSETFDHILLDVPCSALGQRPLLRNCMTMKMLKSYIPLQRKLFSAAVKLLKKSGRLVYSTCTITEEECEGMVAWALDTFPDLSLIPAEPLLGGPGWAKCGLSDTQRVMVQRFGPERDDLRPVDPIYNDTLGFFIACFKKNDNATAIREE